jgi:hypothetical protein
MIIREVDSQKRWIGCLMPIAGGVLAYFSIVSPLVAASRHEEDVDISLKTVMLALALLVFGLILLIMGNGRGGQLFGTRQRPSAIGLAICVVTAAIGILLYEWLKSRLRGYGYGV